MTESHPPGRKRVHPDSINSRKLFQAAFLSAGHKNTDLKGSREEHRFDGDVKITAANAGRDWAPGEEKTSLKLSFHAEHQMFWSWDVSVCFYFGFQRADLHFATFWWHPPIAGWTRDQLKHSKFFCNDHKMICDSVNCSIPVSMERITGCKHIDFFFFFFFAAKVNSLTFLFLPLPALQVSPEHF